MKNIRIKILAILCLVLLLLKSTWFNEIGFFLKEAYKNIGITGAIAPISHTTADHILNKILETIKQNKLEKIKILEAGPGTGSLSQYIISNLEKHKVNFTIDLVEINKEFSKILDKKFKNNSKVKIYYQDILQWHPKTKYNFIISTIPFNTKYFTADIVKNILEKYHSLIDLDGIIFWVEYAAFGKISTLFLNQEEKEIYLKKHMFIDEFKSKHQVSKDFILFNLPPLYLYYAKLDSVFNKNLNKSKVNYESRKYKK
ncbi:class I SAM-dependent methyltransferase [Candidatus Babela massiliensis]|uniref:16S ribosomal RNA methyltransferase KsgA/Dim1 n=1 Tax=Candidatus Babela massiliensis TaxID=673862 RepID=V6DH11_9BACT|nr:SAM-dependent methyltransferase [Candidatus Babela massiliensis]CDK30882.1 16S ribosomal RNA methyltransferase KsgA/Dim1 [Candidatus Babela massiliensis]